MQTFLNGLPNPSLVPFVVAGTGHRDLRPQDMQPLASAVRNIFAEIRGRMPNTPLVFLSGMAEGSDQLIASIAMEEGVFVAAVLPMPLDIYKTTMSPAAQLNLDDLLARSAARIVLPLEARTRDELLASEEARADCYEALAQFLAQHSQALIALWDGKHSDRRGGTSEVVRYVRSGSVKQDADESESRCGVVYQVVTPRLSGTGTPNEVRTITLGCEMHQDEEHGRKTFAQVERNFDRFNAGALRLKAPVSPSVHGLIKDPSVTLSPFQHRLRVLYEKADAISIQANSKRRGYLMAMLGTAICGTLLYGMHIEIFGRIEYLWPTFPLFAGIAVALHWHAHRHHVEEQYLDYRALAEALRVQFFWDMAGIQQPVDRYYLSDHRTELDWIRYALKNIWLLHLGSGDDSGTANPQAVLEHWVKDQQKWYSDKAEWQTKSVRQREKFARYALVAAVLWAVLVVLGLIGWNDLAHWHVLGNAKPLPPDSKWNEFFHVVLALPVLLAGGHRLWVEQAGYEEQSREYSYMQRQFSRKMIALEGQLQSPEAAERLLIELGIEALQENGRWLLLHRDRPLEVLGGM